jgi:nitrite reductase/ring-hydroxylating ferredoxin subunit
VNENGRWQPICRVSEVPEDDVRRFEVDGLPALAVYNLSGDFYVTNDCCTHMEASLAEGTLDGDVIECPFHGGAFNVRTGEVAERPPVKPLPTYETRVDNDVVVILVA